MCFSAPISFTASGVLGVTGIASVLKKKSGNELPLAMIPFFFGVQQLIEGFIWIGIGESMFSSVFVYGFLFFAYLLWPIYIPAAIMLVEPSLKKRTSMKALLITGILASTYLVVMTLLYHQAEVSIIDCHIGHPYSFNRWYIFGVPFYLAAVGIAPLLSSYKYLRIFGVAIIASCIATLIITLNTFTSVWCFAAAILSSFIYLHFLDESRK